MHVLPWLELVLLQQGYPLKGVSLTGELVTISRYHCCTKTNSSQGSTCIWKSSTEEKKQLNLENELSSCKHSSSLQYYQRILCQISVKHI